VAEGIIVFVYLLLGWVDYEGYYPKGVFEELDDAMAWADRDPENDKRYLDGWVIHKWEIDGNVTGTWEKNRVRQTSKWSDWEYDDESIQP